MNNLLFTVPCDNVFFLRHIVLRVVCHIRIKIMITHLLVAINTEHLLIVAVLVLLLSLSDSSCLCPEQRRLQFSESSLMLWYVTFSPNLSGAKKSTAVP